MPVRVGASAGSSNGVVYLTIKNGSREEDRLTGVEAPVCGSVRIHRTTMERDRMMMQPVNEPIEIAAGGSVRFQPRGLHIMLIGLKRSLVAGETFRLVLRFEKGGLVEAVSKIKTP